MGLRCLVWVVCCYCRLCVGAGLSLIVLLYVVLMCFMFVVWWFS